MKLAAHTLTCTRTHAVHIYNIHLMPAQLEGESNNELHELHVTLLCHAITAHVLPLALACMYFIYLSNGSELHNLCVLYAKCIALPIYSDAN